MSRGRVAIGFALALALAAGSGAAAEPLSEHETQRQLSQPNYARGGYYIGAEGNWALENTPLVGGTTSSGGADLRVGYRPNRWFGFELMARYVHSFGSGQRSFLAWGMSLNGRFYPLRGRFQPYLSAGPGFVQARPQKSFFVLPGGLILPAPDNPIGFAARMGLGFEIYTNENFAVTVDGSYTLPVGAIADYDFITAGLGFQFY